MRRYIIRRLLQAVALLFIMSIAFFGLLHAIPGGGPEAVIINPKMSPQTRLALRHKWGLDLPVFPNPLHPDTFVHNQYVIWLGNLLHGDFGVSIFNGQPVTSEIGSRLQPTLELFLATIPFALIIALLLGVLSAVRQYSITDYTVTVLSYFGISMPVFFWALVLQLIFAVQLHWLPTFGVSSADTEGFSASDVLIDRGIHLILPVIALSLIFIAAWSRFLRSSMLDVIKQDYIRTARAKGLSPRTVFWRHALRNALIPLITVVALATGGIFSGAPITETVFARPGLGTLFLNALTLPDYPILMALLIISTAGVIIFNLVGDLLYAAVDPRIRYS